MPDNRRFSLFSRAETKKFALVDSPSETIQTFTANSTLDVTQTPMVYKTPDKYGRERRKDALSETVFVKLLHSTEGKLFIEETPLKADSESKESAQPREVLFKDIASIEQLKQQKPELFVELKKELFSFKVTAETLQKRVGIKRPRSQNEVMSESARSALVRCGAELQPGTEVHWAHRHGWSLGGPQTQDNLDLGTAGSNYSTLLIFESPLKYLILKQNIPEIQVHGTAYLHPLIEIPLEIQYEFTWGNGRKLTGSTYPLEYRKPTRTEYDAACTLFAATRTPKSTNVSVGKLSCESSEEVEVVRALSFS